MEEGAFMEDVESNLWKWHGMSTASKARMVVPLETNSIGTFDMIPPGIPFVLSCPHIPPS